jgi:hypothetical protein
MVRRRLFRMRSIGLEDLLDHTRPEALRRLVEEEEIRPGHEAAAEGDHLLLPAGQRARQLLAPLAEHGKRASTASSPSARCARAARR